MLFGEKLFLQEEDGRKIDLGAVGQVTHVNAQLIELLCTADTIPVIAPLAQDRAGILAAITSATRHTSSATVKDA